MAEQLPQQLLWSEVSFIRSVHSYTLPSPRGDSLAQPPAQKTGEDHKDKMADERRSLPMFVVDAFTNKPFGGNPAAVCLIGSEVSCFIL